jgi:hypothetical protein
LCNKTGLGDSDHGGCKKIKDDIVGYRRMVEEEGLKIF